MTEHPDTETNSYLINYGTNRPEHEDAWGEGDFDSQPFLDEELPEIDQDESEPPA